MSRFDAKRCAAEFYPESTPYRNRKIASLEALLISIRNQSLEEAAKKVRNGVTAGAIQRRIRALKVKP